MSLHEAIRACYTGRATQEQLEELTGIPQQTISRYARGTTEPSPSAIQQIEAACDRPAGWIYVHAGLVADVRSVLEAIAMDPALDDHGRENLLLAYEGAVNAARSLGPR